MTPTVTASSRPSTVSKTSIMSVRMPPRPPTWALSPSAADVLAQPVDVFGHHFCESEP